MKMNSKNRWIIIAIFIGLFEVLFVTAMGSIVGPQIVADLKDTNAYAFMYTLNFLCSSLALPISAMIGKKIGRKIPIVLGVVLFGVSTGLAGAATSMTFHTLMRGVQGIGKGFILGNALAYFGESLDASGRGKAMGFYGTLTGIVYVAAPLVGGVIGDFLGWRLTFYISVPMTVIVLLILLLRMENVRPDAAQANLDWIGTGLLCGATIGIVMMFSWGGQKYPWISAPVLIMAAMFVVCTVCFINYIKKAANPIFSARLFANREFVLVILSVVLIGPSMFSVGSYLSLQSMAICGTNATVVGLVTAAKSAVQLLLGYFVGSYIGKSGKVKQIMILTSVVYALSGLMLGFISGPADFAIFVVGILLSGLGTTTYSVVYTLHAQNQLPKNLIGEGTSAIQFFQSMSGTIGLSIVGMVMNTRLAANLKDVVPAGLEKVIPAEELQSYMGTSLLTNSAKAREILNGLDANSQVLFQRFLENLRSAFAGAMRSAMIVLAVLAAVSLVAAFFVKNDSSAKKQAE